MSESLNQSGRYMIKWIVIGFLGTLALLTLLVGIVIWRFTPVIKVDEKMESSIPGLFAVGDCRVTPLRQVAVAVGDGAIAATMAEEYVSAMEGRLYAGKAGKE